jgi:hypothetical protein
LLWSQTYVDNYLITTLGKNNSHYNCETGSCWFDWALKVRVSKPTVWTTWWGSSYLASSDDVSNIKDVSLTNNDWDKNFVWPSIWTDGLSSTTTTSTNTSKAQAEWDKYNTSANAWDTIWATATITSTNLWDFQNYNWLPNVFILKNKNFSITSSIFNSLSNSTTYIIEDWDLTVNADITYPDNINIAFVIKWWNVEISKDVKNLRWIFITISKWSIWWQILWVGWKTTETLNVNGSLYGNVENLVSQRTYVKQNANWLLDVWTVVNFDSSTFRDPAPLVTLFIQEYLETMKVAQ